RVSASCSLVPASTPGCVERRKNRLLTSGYGIARGWNTAAKGTLRDPPVPFNGGSMLAEALEKGERCGQESLRRRNWETSQTAKLQPDYADPMARLLRDKLKSRMKKSRTTAAQSPASVSMKEL